MHCGGLSAQWDSIATEDILYNLQLRCADTGGWARLISALKLCSSHQLHLAFDSASQSSAWSEFASSCSEGGAFFLKQLGSRSHSLFFVVSAILTCCSVLEKRYKCTVRLSFDLELIQHSLKVWKENDPLYPKHSYRKLIQQWRGQIRPLFSWS